MAHGGTLAQGDRFDFTIPSEEAYGPRDEERVITLAREVFEVDGRFDSESIFDGQNILSVSEGEFLLDRDALSVEWFNNVLYILTDCPSGLLRLICSRYLLI